MLFRSIQLDVYEAAAQFKEIGAGVMIWARTWEILSLLGMSEDFARIAHARPDKSPGERRILSFSMPDVPRPYATCLRQV